MRLGVFFLCALFGFAVQARAANFVVDRTDDTLTSACTAAANDCSLRGAIIAANNAAGDDNITFDTTVFATPHTITLNGTQLDITGNVQITGPGASLLTVSGNSVSRVFRVGPGVTARIENLAIRLGKPVAVPDENGVSNSVDDSGGGILNDQGILTVVNCVFTDNIASSEGGAIYNNGFLNRSATLTVENCSFSNNIGSTGGGISSNGNFGSTMLTVSGSTFFDNEAGSYGGGIYSNGRGGNATLTLSNSTFSANRAVLGGGVANDGRWNGTGNLTVTNCTFSGNFDSDTEGVNVGSGAGIFNDMGTTLLGNSLFSGASNGGQVDSTGGSFTSAGYNISSDDLSAFLVAPTDKNNTDPLLGPLANNGGPTQTHALLVGSPAIDAGNTALTTDQRGIARPQGGADDIGAYELDAAQSGPNYQVNTTDDHDDGVCDTTSGCTLREAIKAANGDGADSTITFASGVTGTIQLTSALPVLRTNLALQGPGAANLTVRAQGTAANYEVFEVGDNVTISISGLTITNGSALGANYGGGIYNRGRLTVQNCVLSDNVATYGGGIANSGFASPTLRVTNCTFRNNNAAFGGAIYNVRALTIENCTFSSNNGRFGAGLYNATDAATVSTVNNSTFSGNQALDNDIGRGGAIFHNSGQLNLSNCTIANNSASINGGGIVNNSLLQIGNSILSANTSGTESNLANTSNGTVSSNGYNISSDDLSAFLTEPTDKNNTDPLLGPLANNGGPTQTHALLPGSPAINAGNTALTTDQRGIARPQGSADDIGAYEFQYSGNTSFLSVTLQSDELDGDFGASDLSLREAIYLADFDSNASAITFDATIFAAPRKAITLNGTHIPITGSGTLSITAPAAGVTLDGANQSRIFYIMPGANVSLRGLTISGGNSALGGGILNLGRTLIEGCTFTGNHAGGGGAIASLTDLNGTTLTLRNCTLSGNSADNQGGGLSNLDGLTVIEASTITNNSAAPAQGGGVCTGGEANTRTEVKSSIIAGNTDSDVDFDGPANTFQSNGYNLIGSGTSNNTFRQFADIRIGGAAPGLAPLAENGGKTPTHALLSGSPALNAGENALTVDQRGITRPQGARADIGAYELIFLQIADASISEGDSGTTDLTFTVMLSTPVEVPVQVNYIVSNGTARSGSDFNGGAISDSDGATPGTLTIPAGQISGSISVPISGDTLDEANEVFYALLSSPVNAFIARGRGVGTITDNDAAPSITVDNVTVVEGNSGSRLAVFTLRLSAPSGQLVSVTAQSANGTATAGSDYTALPPTVINFTTGYSAAIARVLVHGDALDEQNETFVLNLSNPVNATIADNQGLASITDDDRTPQLNITDASISEGNSGTKVLNFTATLSAASGQTVTVNYTTANGAAKAGSDYLAANGSVSFATGEVSKTISITINGDTTVEPDELFYVILSGATNAAIGRGRGVGTITNDDASG